MKLLLDQGLPRSAVKHLADAGISAEHVGDIGMAAATDEAILEEARRRQAVVITLDADFHLLLAAMRATGPSVVRVRMEGLKGERLAALLAVVIASTAGELTAGAAISVTETKIRVRLLPLGS